MQCQVTGAAEYWHPTRPIAEPAATTGRGRQQLDEACLRDVVDPVLHGIAAPPSGGQSQVAAVQ
jgi:hypothetical protein